MLINGRDIETLGIKLWDRVITSNQINTHEDWIDGDIKPTYIRQQDKFKNIKLTFLILEHDEEKAFYLISQLTAELKHSSVKFDDIDLVFDVNVQDYAQPERLKNGCFKIVYNLTSDYAKGERETYTTNANLTNSFRLNILYYKNDTELLQSESKVIYSMKFNEETGLAAWEDIGVDIDKYKPEYYTSGSTNLGNLDITYSNLQNLGTLIVNYEPVVYTLEIKHYMNDGAGTYQLLLNATNTFTQVILERGATISQLCGVSEFKPQGYSANVAFTGDLTVENILAQSPVSIYYDQVVNERSKNVVVSYYAENDDGEYAFTNATIINVKETEVYQGTMLSEFINLNLYRPNILYYDAGVLQEHSLTETVDNYDDIELNYEVRYPRTNNRVYVEYFLGAYPNWYRYTTETIITKYQTSYDTDFDLTDLGIEVDKYKRAEYYNGVIVNSEAFTSYDSVLSAGVIQVYYLPISYPIVVNYYKDNDTTNVIATETVQINELMFFNNTLLSDIVDLDTHKPENYQLDLANSYSGDLTLSALTQASPISIMYSEIEADRTKNIIIRYKKELSSTFSTINTSIITVAESQIASGVRLGALIALDAQRPEYYDHGILDGVSTTEIVNYDTVGSDYSVIYMATSYSLPVRYYTDDIDEANWIGSDIINYRVIDFTTATTLYTLGVNVNQFKPVYGDNGVIQYNGPITFGALQELSSINIVYDTIEEPDDGEIDYPHRFLFLQHNDLGPFEHLHPTWTLNHAYINTGVTCDDIGKLGIVIDVAPEDDHANISSVNYRASFLFGSRSIYGDCYLGLFNASQYISSDAEMAYDLYNMTNMAGQTPFIRMYPSGSVNIQQDQELYPWRKNGSSGDWELKGYAATSSHGYIRGNYLNTYIMSHMGKYTPMQMWLQGQSLTPLVLREYGTQDFDNVVVINNTDYNDEAARYYDSYYINELTGAVEGQGNSINTRIYGSAFITLRNTFPLLIEAIPIYYPIYLFACNEEGNYRGGLAGYGIYSAKFYYNNVLIRDFIPVETYDKIGDQVAPSNCLYDKVSKTFFEDATGKNSFNIRDDERVVDINPEHQIGHLYVNYYRGTTIFKQEMIYFRGNDFDDGWDPYEKLSVDENQPRYFGQGVIQNVNEISFTFQGLRNITISVIYPALDQNITVNYYTEENGARQLLASEDLTINEQTFYQSPTFGDIIRLNKYKPTGYETNFEFAGNKITLNQMVINSPYDIVYTPIDGELTYYTTTIIYKKKVFGVRNYEEIGRTTITLDNTDFRDGEYIDYYINLNLMKPENYYLDGESYGWYLMDERLSNPSDLKEAYEIHYMPAVLYKDINYYTDDWDEANLIASTSWSYQIDDFDPEERFYLIDLLDNEYTNKYRPANCDGGILQNSDVSLDFEDLVALEEIAFVYDSVEEPNDPESAMYEQKVLYFGNIWDDKLTATSFDAGHDLGNNEFGAYIPYIDLGYKPKDLKRLRVELQGFARPYGINDSWVNSYSNLDLSYAYFFGYYGAPEYELSNTLKDQVVIKNQLKANKYSKVNDTSVGSKGCFAIRPRLPEPSGWSYSSYGPQYLDGQLYYPAGSPSITPSYEPEYRRPGIVAEYRFGYSYDTDIDYNPFQAYRTYILSYEDSYSENADYVNNLTDGYQMTSRYTDKNSGFANPFTIIMDGYHNYMSIYDYRWNNYPETWQITNLDRDIFEDLEQPQGSLTLFRTTNPTTGKVNIMPWDFGSYHQTNSIVGGFGTALAYQSIQINPYNISFNDTFTIKIQSWVATSHDNSFITNAAGNVVYTGDWSAAKRSVSMDIELKYMNFTFPTFPQITSAAVWGLKIYDRDRLVRWLIPVAEGDVIYDYTMPSNGLFDLITEIFFTNANKGGHYILEKNGLRYKDLVVSSDEVWPLYCIPDPIVYGKITTNYYDYDNSFIDNQFVNIPTWFDKRNTTIEDILKFNDYKPDNYRLDGWLDLDSDLSFENMKLSEIFELGTANVYYRLRTYTKTITYYRSNSRIGTKDIFYSEQDIQNATTLADLGVDVDEFYDPQFAHGRLVFNESIIADDDIATFIDAPSPIVIYDKLTAQEAPNLFYVEYYRGGAYDNGLITLDENDNNYLDCNLTAKVLNPNGAIKYDNHYHSALYEDEERDYFIPYQVHVDNHYTGIHNGPGRMYKTLANIVVEDTYTIIQERNGWGKLKEYRNGWILLNQTTPITGPGQNPEYDVAGSDVATIPFASEITITKLTIDRLWAWVPAVDSWVKTEDISYDQSGKLYNALAIEVINLNEIAWADPQLTFADIVDVNKYKLRFHDNSLYTYTGIMSQGAFELLHSLEIVYPETIYTYTCIYYKDNKAAANELGRSAFSCTISDWNPDWDTFISTSWQVDENEDPINPTLYRDTPITLNWDYFGFDRNAFKPTGYYDGIYLWNPRTWDKDNIKFTFDELIRCGTQYVIYPCFKPDMFKIWIQKNYLGQYVRASRNNTLQQTIRSLTPLNNNGIQVDLSAESGPSSFYNYKTDQDKMCYDIYVSGEFKKDLTYKYPVETVDGPWPTVSDFSDNWDHTRGWNTEASSRQGTYMKSLNRTFSGIDSVFPQIEEGDSFIINISNHREYPTEVYGFGGVVKQKDFTYYTTTGYNASDWIKIEDNTNLSTFGLLDTSGDTYALQPSESLRTNIYPGWFYTNYQNVLSGVIYDVISYYNFEMIHYWIPVPKGMWYRYNGEDLRIQDNGMFDLLTGEFERSYRTSDGALGVLNSNGTIAQNPEILGTAVNGNDYIYYRDREITNAYNYFVDWSFTQTTLDNLIVIGKDPMPYGVNYTQTYTYPDILSPQLYASAITSGTVVPVIKYTNDSENNVVGEWYYSCGRWFDATCFELYEGAFDKVNLTADYKTVVLLGSDNELSGSYYIFRYKKDPTSATSSGGFGSSTGYIVKTVYYRYSDNGTDYYFDGQNWFLASYTDQNHTPLNKTYAIAYDTIEYSIPVADEQYRVGKYLPGDRVYIPYVATQQPVWGWTGSGWVGLESNVSEVI